MDQQPAVSAALAASRLRAPRGVATSKQGRPEMTCISSFKMAAAGALGIAALASILPAAPIAVANAADQSALQVPQSVSYEHEQIIEDLTNFAKREVAHASAAQKALIVIKAH